MKYFNYLRNTFRSYLISGIILGLAIFLSIISYRYNNYLLDTLHLVENISINKRKVENQTHKIDTVIKYLKGDLNRDITDFYHERLIFQTLDKIKTEMQDVSITVTAFEETEGLKRLPVEIKAPVETYKKIINYVGYIESFTLPDYKINQLSISKEQTGDIILKIQGAIVMPSLKRNTYETETIETIPTDG